jgi:hypothetical protein
MLRACRDDAWLAQLRQGAERAAARFSWQRCAELTVEAYRCTLGVECERLVA